MASGIKKSVCRHSDGTGIGIGYTTEKHVERHLRDARLLTIAGGPNEVHKDTLGAAVYDTHQDS